jgi:FAD/FMN-containing dehydrogenase
MATAMEPTLDEAAVQQFKAGFRGALLRPGDDGYDAARRVWNGMIDRRPALIARCAGVADVIAAVRFARESGLPATVRGGGHNVTGTAVCDGGLMIDVSLMKGLRVDPHARTARAQAGLTWGEFDHETQAFGLAVTGGQISTTGIAGLTLGGGIGWLMRRCGLVVDNLLSVDLVTADARFLTASATENADLFWGLRGGGGNFGVATSFEYRLHPVGPILMAGMTLYPAEQAADVLRFYRSYMETAPDELMVVCGFLTAPPAPFVPPHLHGAPMVALILCYAGPVEDAAPYVARLRSFAPPAVDLIAPMPYVAVQRMSDAAQPPGMQVYVKSAHLRDLRDEAIEALVRHAARVTSPVSALVVLPMGGAVARVAAGATAFGHRTAPFDFVCYSQWTDPAEHDRHVAWARDLAEGMRPFTHGAYVNELGDLGEDVVHEAYPPDTYARLVALKNTYDPTNMFRFNQNVKPTV